MRAPLVLAAALLVAGCAASPFPEALTRSVNRSLSLAQIRADPPAHRGEQVILGGEILATTPRPGETEMEVLSRRLDSGDAPERSDASPGRFLARTPGFLDPAVYARGRGHRARHGRGVEERPVGELPYVYPVIAAERVSLGEGGRLGRRRISAGAPRFTRAALPPR
jgi:outer membrane lipoprotein